MNQHLRSALRFSAYIRALGGDPISFKHGSHREWALHLQRQHERLRRSVDPAFATAATARARDLIRNKGYRRAAEEAAPTHAAVSDTQHDCVPSSPGQDGAVMIDQTAAAQSASETRAPSVDAACRRKLRHPDLWSAIIHARRLGGGVQTYICHCGGVHVGHPANKRTREYRRARKCLRAIDRRLLALDQEWVALLREKRALRQEIREPERLADMVSDIMAHVRGLVRILRERCVNRI